MYMTDHINSEYTHSAEPSPQVWLKTRNLMTTDKKIIADYTWL